MDNMAANKCVAVKIMNFFIKWEKMQQAVAKFSSFIAFFPILLL
jgi:hypothetical protein